MKFDKDTLVRQRFWVGLGAFVLIWAIDLLTAMSAGSSQVEGPKKQYDDAAKALDTLKKGQPKNESYWILWDKNADRYRSQKGGVWEVAWESQKTFITWPESNPRDEANPAKVWEDSKSFEEWYQKFDKSDFSYKMRERCRQTLYRDQFHDDKNPARSFFEVVKPVEYKGGLDGFKMMMVPTQAGAGSGMGALAGPGIGPGPRERPSSPTGPTGQTGARNVDNFFIKGTTPSTEECWYAQEDYWIKREVVNAVKRTLDASGKCVHEEPGFWFGASHLIAKPDRAFSRDNVAVPKPEDKATVVAHHRYRNASWELDLLFVKIDGKTQVSINSTIRNVHVSQRIQALSTPPPKPKEPRGPIVFRVWQTENPDRSFNIAIRGSDQPWNGWAVFGPDQGKPRTIEVEFDPTKPFEVEEVLTWRTSPIRRIDDIKTCVNSHRTADRPLKSHPILYQPSTDPAAGPNPAGPAGPGVPVPPPGGDAVSGGSTLAPATEQNGLERNRYYNITEPCRDLPFAVVLVVEQAHLHDFLVQLANSDLRVQITQVHFQRVRNVAPPLPPGDPTDPTRPPMPPIRPGEGNFNPQGAIEAIDPNLVELTVYGIAAMYEKYKKPEAPKTGEQPK